MNQNKNCDRLAADLADVIGIGTAAGWEHEANRLIALGWENMEKVQKEIDDLETWHPKNPDGSPDPSGIVWCDYDAVRRILGMKSEK